MIVLDSIIRLISNPGDEDYRQLVNGATAAEQDALLTADVAEDEGDLNGVKVEEAEADEREGAVASNKQHKRRKKKQSSRDRGGCCNLLHKRWQTE